MSPPPNSSATSEPAMPQRVRDVFAWIRLFMSNGGPPATTRLVLFAHSLFMDRDGSHCRVGVRRLADITGLDKTTLAQHRAAAIKRGWLIGSKPPRGQGSGEILTNSQVCTTAYVDQ